MKDTNKKDVGCCAAPVRPKVKDRNLLEENKKLRHKVAKAKAKLRAVEKEKANQNEKLATKISKLKQKLSEGRSELKAANDLNAELKGNLVIATRKLEHCTKIFSEKTWELVFLSEHISIGLNELSTKRGSESLWGKKAQVIQTVLALKPSDSTGPPGETSLRATLARIVEDNTMFDSEPGLEGTESVSSLPRPVENLANDDSMDSVDDCISQIREDWMIPQVDISTYNGGQSGKRRKGNGDTRK